jgi:hypothetical protein
MRQDFQLVNWVLILPILKYWRLGTWCQKAFVHVIHIICLCSFWCIIWASVPKEDRTTGVSPGDFAGYTIWWIDTFEWNIRIIYILWQNCMVGAQHYDVVHHPSNRWSYHLLRNLQVQGCQWRGVVVDQVKRESKGVWIKLYNYGKTRGELLARSLETEFELL